METVKEKLASHLVKANRYMLRECRKYSDCNSCPAKNKRCRERYVADYLIQSGVTILECGMDCKSCWKTKIVNPVQEWVSVDERLPEDGTPVAVILTPTYASDYWGYGIARYIDTSNGERHWYEDHHGYLEWDKYSDGRGGCSLYKVTHWMPLPEPPKGVQ